MRKEVGRHRKIERAMPDKVTPQHVINEQYVLPKLY